ncbi:class I SAM-dependent methyltransferase [uncultured Algibacter sp.]|uniref:class I SAM-dependent methyltransferase n=1 Tax=uncultured Algibacter sp. TaxID=298659 RepID=UPI0032169D6E
MKKEYLRGMYYMLSPSLRLLVRKIYYLPIDLYESLIDKREKYEPKKGDIYIGSGDFISQGKHHLNLLKKYTNLKESDSVLDIGSGIGRTAVALTKYLNINARYEGFDVVEKGVKWCNSKIKKDLPNFNFIYVPLNNDLYNTSYEKADSFKFPYEDGVFDVVFLFSVFTHMGISEIDNYFGEIERVLKPKGKCLATFFLYTSEKEEETSIIEGFSFPIKKDGYRLMDKDVTSANIAIEINCLKEMIVANNLKLASIKDGIWKDEISNIKSISNEYQDIVILEK